MQAKVDELKANITKMRALYDKYEGLLKSGAKLDDKQIEAVKILRAQLENMNNELTTGESELEELRQEILNSKHAKVSVRRDIYPGTVVSISGTEIIVKDKRSYCMLEKKNGEIVYNSL